jgi:hypothetical protein
MAFSRPAHPRVTLPVSEHSKKMKEKSFKKWAKEYKWQKRRKAISEFFGKSFVYSIIALICIGILVWVGVYVWYLAPYTRAFCFDYLGLYSFPGIFHAVPMFGIPILFSVFLKAVYNIVKNRSTIKPEYLKKNN